MMMGYFYFLSNSTRTLLYAGATQNLKERLLLHEKGKASVFTKKYHLKYLVYYEVFASKSEAFVREKQIKNWRKEWKWNLIKETNPDLIDLKSEIS
ncbi:MAG: GIY-YIG nuclease family protein [Allomuricauda sp.]|nr:MAG: GIY-YIG nuclease family protein [Allomuricauda sp.]